MLAGHHPFSDPDPNLPLGDALERMIAERRRGAPPIRAFNPLVPPSLQAVLLKCLDADPLRRYQRAADLSEDLRRFLDNLSMAHAPEPSLRERAAKWLRRHPEARSSTTIGILAASLLGVIGLIGWTIADRLQTATAVLLRNEFSASFRACQLLLNTVSGPRSHLPEGVRLAEAALGHYGLNGLTLPRDWHARPEIARLAPATRRALLEELSELLMLRARALVRLSDKESETTKGAALRSAIAALDMAEAIDPDPPAALYHDRARMEQSLGWTARAQADRRRGEQRAPTSARDYYLLGATLAAAGRLERATDALSRAVALDSRRFWAWFVLGLCHYDQGMFTEAAADFSVCTILTPNFAWPYLNRGLALASAGRLSEAQAAYDRALEIAPNFVEARVNRALVSLQLDQPDQAAKDLQLALQRQRREPGIVAAHAEALARTGRGDEAERLLNQALAEHPDDPTVLVARGILRLQRDDRAGAETDLRHALERSPNHARAHLGMAHWLRDVDPRDAIKHLNKALDRDATLLEAVQLRALLLARQGDVNALRDVDRLAATPAPLGLYNAACALCLLSSARNDDRYLPRAAELLARALECGFSPEHARSDPDLRPLQEKTEYRRVFSPTSG
jgi:tetratricopeptide (TPR) repeat protein